MAVIKSGDTTDQLHVDTHQSAYVTLRDASGAAVAPLPPGGAVSVSNFPATQTVSGNVTVTSLPAVTVSNFPANQPVTGTFFQATQPVSLASAPLPTNAATESGHLASIDTKLTGPLAVTGAFFQATQPVSAVALPLPTGAATDANLTAHLPMASNGGLEVTMLDGFKATYVAGTSGFAPAAAATDVLTITGSATKTVRITKVYLSFTATTAVSVPVSLIRRSAANTGGTSATFAATPRDTTNPGATAAVAIYTANPTALGAAVGSVLEAGKIPAPLTGGAVQVTVFEFGTGSNQAIVLRGTSQVLAVNLNSVSVTGGSMALAIQWTEE